jgi:hypothetical protein
MALKCPEQVLRIEFVCWVFINSMLPL